MAGATDAASMLGSVPFFSGLDEKKRKSLASQGKEMSYKPGDTIVDEGTMGVGFYLVLDGKAEVRKGSKVLASLGPGQFFGEMSLIDESPRSADVVAVSPTKCWALTAWAFNATVKTNPEVALMMLKEMVKRLRSAQSSAVS
ncbi:MAG TPA: cyclic nucleotide-binding domain-containing protein [Nitrososphaerales archaeon]|nr:cyclic nucleotide-binding domain-containing protein [Nitrososphaerales archaeon]